MSFEGIILSLAPFSPLPRHTATDPWMLGPSGVHARHIELVASSVGHKQKFLSKATAEMLRETAFLQDDYDAIEERRSNSSD
jgi:hypothetical protein